MASSTSPDIEWIRHTIAMLEADGRRYDDVLAAAPDEPVSRRPTSIRRAYEQLVALGDRADSVRAVRLCREHPGKMWVVEDDLMRPLLDQPDGVPLHSRQYKSLPEVYVQDSSIEFAWTRAVTDHDSIAGETVAPFFTEERRGLLDRLPGRLARGRGDGRRRTTAAAARRCPSPA